jgi:hypothetical protein
MRNLLTETLDELAAVKKTESDVLWVGSANGDFAITWDQFKEIANIEYDPGYGGQEIAKDLVIVGRDFWFERYEYDGSEWWEYKEPPCKSPSANSFEKVKGHSSWCSIKEINEETDDD